MNDTLKMLFVDNPYLIEQIEAFCVKDAEYRQVRAEFYEIAEEIARIVGFERYETFEQCFGSYIGRSSDLYYLFGLGLRQEVLDTFL